MILKRLCCLKKVAITGVTSKLLISKLFLTCLSELMTRNEELKATVETHWPRAWLVRSFLEQEVRVRGLVGYIVLCFSVRPSLHSGV